VTIAHTFALIDQLAALFQVHPDLAAILTVPGREQVFDWRYCVAAHATCLSTDAGSTRTVRDAHYAATLKTWTGDLDIPGSPIGILGLVA
jgi:hypothetical protein